MPDSVVTTTAGAREKPPAHAEGRRSRSSPALVLPPQWAQAALSAPQEAFASSAVQAMSASFA